MACKEFNEWGWLYCSEQLSEAIRKQYEAHIAQCARCRALIAEARMLTESVSSLPDDGPSAATRKAIRQAAIANRPTRQSWVENIWQHWRLWSAPVFVAAALLLYVGVKTNLTPAVTPEMLAWDYSLSTEVSSLDMAIATVESRMVVTSVEEEVDAWDSGGLSTFSEDLTAIKSELDALDWSEQAL